MASLPASDLAGAVDVLIALRRAARATTDPAVLRELDTAADFVESRVGPSVGRAAAARLLGISQTALDNWIAKDEIAAVITPAGRREVPLAQLVELAESVALDPGSGPLALARVIQARRRDAESLDTSSVLPAHRTRTAHAHRPAELRSLAYHRAVAQRLDGQRVAEARRQVERWTASGRMHPDWAKEWRGVLAQPLPAIGALLGADTPRARALRQSSPFVGTLTEQERRRVEQALRDAAA